MPQTSHLLAFAAVALGMALTPGPNMIYLLGYRSVICPAIPARGTLLRRIERAEGLGDGVGAFAVLCASFGFRE
jgi:hypothetical protein